MKLSENMPRLRAYEYFMQEGSKLYCLRDLNPNRLPLNIWFLLSYLVHCSYKNLNRTYRVRFIEPDRTYSAYGIGCIELRTFYSLGMPLFMGVTTCIGFYIKYTRKSNWSPNSNYEVINIKIEIILIG